MYDLKIFFTTIKKSENKKKKYKIKKSPDFIQYIPFLEQKKKKTNERRIESKKENNKEKIISNIINIFPAMPYN